jgi:CheY-like chemotaxis protein
LPSILIVEDDLEIAEALADVLTSAGYRTRRARNGIEGLEKIAEEDPDLILLDVEMPLLDGPGMASALALGIRGEPGIPIILISGSVDLAATAARAKIPYHLAKPFRADAVVTLVGRVLASRRG